MYLALATATLVSASPVVAPVEAEIVARATGSSASELESGACRPYTFIFARGSGEFGSMVSDAQTQPSISLATIIGNI